MPARSVPICSSRSRGRGRIPAIEESIFAGVPVMSRCCFARALHRGSEHICAASSGASPPDAIQGSLPVASIFVSRWDVAVNDKVSDEYRNRLGIAIAMRTYQSLPRSAGCTALAETCRCRRATATLAVGQHRHQGSCSPGRSLRSKRWRRPIPSTPCPKRRCSPSPSTAKSTTFYPSMRVMPKRSSPNSLARVSTDETVAADLQREGTAAFRTVIGVS